MKNFIKVLFVFIILTGITYAQSVPFLSNSYRSLNFQCAGFVTEVIPAPNSSSLENQLLYAKTDIGGMYRSNDNGSSWVLISGYKEAYPNFTNIPYSSYITAGFAMHPINPENILVTWGFTKDDANDVQNKCVLYSSNNGANWSASNFPSNKVWFQGDLYERKLGGECIIFDPRTTVNTRCVFVGGISDNASYGPSIFRSADNGVNFSVAYIFPPETQNDTILCIQMHKDLNVMYIGTSKRLYKCDVDLNGNISNMTDISSGFNSGWEVKNIRRILLNAFEDVYVTYGAYNTTSNHIGGGLLQYNHSTSTWYDRTGDFGNYLASNVNYLSTLTWSDNNENVVIAGRVDKPIRKSSDGINWVGEGYSPDYIYFYYDQINGNYPNHQYQDEFTSVMSFVI